MIDLSELKRKSRMVLFQIEESLGQYILRCETNTDCLTSGFVNDVVNRSKSSSTIDTNSMANILEETYLSEVFHIALQTALDTAEYDKINDLKTLFKTYKIFEIRNTLAHPNRPFLPVFWYRIASVASDPLIESLELDDVTEALLSAEDGRIKTPPEEWTKKYIWQIKNNLPDQFEHDITGLVGRKKEVDELRKLLKNPRITTIAIIAPGGIGKTALALELLHDLISEPQTSEWSDAILFVSLKSEKLTVNGIEKLDAIASIEDIKESILFEINKIYTDNLETFEELIQQYADKKLFIFIDNLETLLRDSEEIFNNFNNSLAVNWRLLVTSRMTITNASIIPLEALKKSSAVQLARVYSNRIGQQLSQELVEKIVVNSHNNPLSIRLTIDLYNTGKEIPDSINIANKEIASFSYNNLIETISNNAIAVLETLFIEDSLTRNTLCELLQKDLDEISSAIKELNRTSLITRTMDSDGTDIYTLNSSVRDLLLRSPRNISCRKEVIELMAKQKALSLEIDKKQQNKGIDEYHLEYIPCDLNPNLKTLIDDLNKALKVQALQPIITLFERFNSVKHLYDKEYIYYRGMGRIFNVLNDIRNAITSYKEAIKLNNHPTDKLMLATLYRKNNEFPEARTILEALVKEKHLFTSIYLGSWIFNEYFRTLIYDHDYDQALKYTQNWQSAPKYSKILGSYRASAWKRKVESVIDSNELETIEAMTNAVETMDEVLSESYFDLSCAETIKIFDEIEFCLRREMYLKHHTDVNKWLQFIDHHLLNIVSSYKNYSDADAKVLIEKLQTKNIDNNIFNSERWKEFTKPLFKNSLDYEDALSQDYTICTIYRIPEFQDKTHTRNIFAQDSKKVQYYVHFNTFQGDWTEWKNLKIGMMLAIKANDVMEGKSLASIEAYPIIETT